MTEYNLHEKNLDKRTPTVYKTLYVFGKVCISYLFASQFALSSYSHAIECGLTKLGRNVL